MIVLWPSLVSRAMRRRRGLRCMYCGDPARVVIAGREGAQSLRRSTCLREVCVDSATRDLRRWAA